MRSPHKERKRNEGRQTDRGRAKYGSSVKKKQVEYKHKQRATKCCKKAPKERKELEEGEVSSGESSSSKENPMPVCRFFVRNKCTWGHVCRFKHSAYRSMSNYVMFERLELPKALPMPNAYYEPPPPPSPTWLAPTEQDDSFDNHLSDLKELMHNAGYKVTKPKVIDKSWIQFNDLDTDPYYSQQSPPLQAAVPPWSLKPQRQVTLQINSDSSTPDYSSTTNSLSSTSSSSLERTRKRPRSRHVKHHLLSSSSASCISESSSTNSSEQSFFSYRERSRHKRYRERSSVSFRASNRSRHTRLKYLENKLKDIEERIYRKRARRK